MLAIEHLVTGYGSDAIIRDVSFTIPERSITAVLGHNGAGKSSLVRALIGLIPAWSGRIVLDGTDLAPLPSARRIDAGIAVSFQDDAVFPTLSIATNLRLGAKVRWGRKAWVEERLEHILTLFPKLRERYTQVAYTLSGGERRMLSIGMALMSDPRLIVLDEPSTGLSPSMTQFVLETVGDIRDRLGKSILLVEQNVQQALALADRAVVLKTGQVTYQGSAADLASDATDLVMMF
ncbi:ABC transporter ATP-binding protein [Zavarzinia compransoris]|uniref:ABC transporter ATP-binding protein n=1 Tax=Zavarzinia compransoris TaxID=1264899 RepID=A0A317DT15_9PROT|nr:ABC transporter ATP-binding protein [Zavarzinia compransoris]PWR17809.1 ABC transporter ATP-binding protein [Zavarzinia compransoris]TDP49342.1 branched-chain amino acid transport system ATP-binding protein [Zavarzinia compransoris]